MGSAGCCCVTRAIALGREARVLPRDEVSRGGGRAGRTGGHGEEPAARGREAVGRRLGAGPTHDHRLTAAVLLPILVLTEPVKRSLGRPLLFASSFRL